MRRLRWTSLFLGVALLGGLPGGALASEAPSVATGGSASAPVVIATAAVVNAAAVAVAAGGGHTCALLAGGTVRCWGVNGSGQLGDGTTTEAPPTGSAPVTVIGISTATAITAGYDYTCAILADGTMRCWGWNGFGQLGDGTTTDRHSPVTVTGILSATAIAADGNHTCALLAGGTVRCWGSNSDGQLGNGTTTASPRSVAVYGIASATAIAAGDDYACALLAGGTVRCWGSNGYGQLGDGTTTNRRTTVAVTGISTVTAITAGGDHSCAVVADGAALCWGSNWNGQLGVGTSTESSTPVAVSGISTATAISAGGDHSCAVVANGAALCWGSNGHGQLGDGTSTASSTPVAVTGISTATGIAAGLNHSCALLANHTVRCWGSNGYGQLGDGTFSDSSTPVAVSGITTATAITAGLYHTCALMTGGKVRCWGYNSNGQLGNGTTINWSSPVTVSGISTATAITAGGAHTCALLSGGTVRCWGWNAGGQLGDGTTKERHSPVAVSGITTATAITAGYGHTCALLTGGSLRCWGGNYSGSLGDGTTNGSSTPVTVTGISTATAITASERHTCALLTGGTVRCWGFNGHGQLGDGTTTERHSPVAVSGISTATAIAAGYWSNNGHTCALLAGGAIRCWGWNGSGQLGDGTVTYSAVPMSVVGLGKAYAATTYHAIAPARVLDTRPTAGEHTNIGLSGKFKAGIVRTFGVANVHYVGGGSAVAVPASATAITGNLTIVGETASGLVALGPTMTPTGAVTTINFVKGDIRANNVTLGLGTGGKLSAVFRSSPTAATVELIFDVTGYFTPATTGATYHPLAPGRVLDSRPTAGAHANIGLTGKFANRVVRNFRVSGVKGIGWSSALVPTGARAVTGNLTVTGATSAGYVALGPTMTSSPETSTINVLAGSNRANGVTVSLSSSGKLGAIWCGTAGSSADVIFDVTGFFTADASGLHYYPIVPVRLLDSSTGKGLSGAFATGKPRTLTLGGVGAIPATAAGISGNLTVVNPSSKGYAFISPTLVTLPTSSTVNTDAHISCANGLDVRLSSGKVALIWMGTAGSSATLQLDVTGYWK